MDTRDRVELLVERRGTVIALLSPEVGVFTGARRAGDLLAGGADAGVLLALGRARRLVVPPGIEGRVVTEPPASTRQPVSWGELLYEIRPVRSLADGVGDARVDAGAETPRTEADPASGDAAPARLVFRSPQSGRLHLRPSPSEEPFVDPGTIVEEGQPVGLIEVMKTFAHLRYSAAGGLPPRARVSRILVADGADIGAGEPLFEVEPATSP